MGLREDIQRKIDKKQQELAERDIAFQIEKASAAAYIQAMQDMLKSLPRDFTDAKTAQQVLRPGSAMARVKEAIEAAGKPLHILEILRAIGRPPSKENRTSIGGSISNYARRGEIFVRTAPNTFGLLGMEGAKASEPPDDFGEVRVRPASLVPIPDDDGDEEADGDDPSDYDTPF